MSEPARQITDITPLIEAARGADAKATKYAVLEHGSEHAEGTASTPSSSTEGENVAKLPGKGAHEGQGGPDLPSDGGPMRAGAPAREETVKPAHAQAHGHGDGQLRGQVQTTSPITDGSEYRAGSVEEEASAAWPEEQENPVGHESEPGCTDLEPVPDGQGWATGLGSRIAGDIRCGASELDVRVLWTEGTPPLSDGLAYIRTAPWAGSGKRLRIAATVHWWAINVPLQVAGWLLLVIGRRPARVWVTVLLLLSLWLMLR